MSQPYTDARDFLVKRALSTPVPKLEPGSSSYFSKPTNDLDPRLFPLNSDHLLTGVRDWIYTTVYTFWHEHGYAKAPEWSTVWIAGSGITHQWSASRGGIGDLDVLIGVDFTAMRAANPRFQGFSEKELAEHFNNEFRTELDPLTANWNGFEVTFYVNPGASNIRDINPYAAYNVTRDSWTVHPITIPSDWDPEQVFPQDWWRAVHEETALAKTLLDSYRKMRSQLRGERNPGVRRNLATALASIVRTSAILFNDIHLSRRNAFSHDGKGYMDWYNFRWQAHKRDGVVPALHVMANLDAEAQKAAETALYGEVLTDSAAALTAAAMATTVLDGVRL